MSVLSYNKSNDIFTASASELKKEILNNYKESDRIKDKSN